MKTHFFTSFVVCFLGFHSSVSAIDWLGGEGNWETPSRWSCNCIPSMSDAVYIPEDSYVIINGSAQANSIRIHETSRLLNNSGMVTRYIENYGEVTNASGGIITIDDHSGNGILNWVNAEFYNLGTLNISRVSEYGIRNLGYFENDLTGTINISNLFWGDAFYNDGGTLVNQYILNISDIPDSGIINHRDGLITNNGNISISDIQEIGLSAGTFNNNGTLHIEDVSKDGANRLASHISISGSTKKLTNTGIIEIPPPIASGLTGNVNTIGCRLGGMLDNDGTISAVGNIYYCGGTIGGILTIGGANTIKTLSLEPSKTINGELNIEIAGNGNAGAANGYDRLNIRGTGTISGTLNLSLLNSFEPQFGDKFQVVTCNNGCNGVFDSIIYLQDPVIGEWRAIYNPNDVTVEFVAVCSPKIANESDCDTDGILDHIDNCPNIPNQLQLDQDADGIGDACDQCICSILESCETNNGAMQFNGSSYAYVPDHSSLDLANQLTVEAWINIQGQTGTNQNLVRKNDNYALGYIPSSYNTIRVQVHRPNSSPGTWVRLDSHVSPSVLEGNWVHVAMTYESGDFRMYINGVLENSTTELVGQLNTTNAPLHFSSVSFRVEQFFNGALDEVRIWNIVRTSEEIANYKDVRLNGNESGLVGYWNFESGQGNQIEDLSLNDNDATLGNGNLTPSWITAHSFVLNDENSDGVGNNCPDTSCPDNLNISAVTNGSTYLAKNIQSNAIVNTGDTVIFSAKDVVVLNHGFHANLGSEFGVRIGGCENDQTDNTNFNVKNTNNLLQHSVHLEVYPNPASDDITINSMHNYHKYIIYNQVGEVMYQCFSNGRSISIDISHLQSGIYFLGAISDELMTTEKIVIE